MENSWGYVYFLYDYSKRIGRLGMSSSCTYERVNGQIAYYPGKLTLYKWHVYDPLSTEGYLHKLFKPQRVKASWYKTTPDVFLRYTKEYSSKDIIGVRSWVNDPVQRGIKEWVLVIDGKKHFIYEETKGRTYIKKRLFWKDDKTFYINFRSEASYYAARSGISQSVTITNKSNTKQIKGFILLREVSDCDPLVKEYIKNNEFKTKGFRRHQSKNKYDSSILTN